MARKFDHFLSQYGDWLHEVADDYVVIMRTEVAGIFGTVGDAQAIAEWDEFLNFVEGPAPFKEKYERYIKLKQQACGLPTRIQ